MIAQSAAAPSDTATVDEVAAEPAELCSAAHGSPWPVADHFLDADGDSLPTTRLIPNVYRHFNAELTYADAFDHRAPAEPGRPDQRTSVMSVRAPAPGSPSSRCLRVLVAGTSSDAHTWNLMYLQLFLEEAGHAVTNLGPCVPDQLLTDTCVRRRPDALVLSSVNGHGHVDVARAVTALRRDRRLTAMPVVVGGLLATAGRPNADYARPLLAAGVSAVLETDELPELLRFLAGLRAGSPDGLKAAG